MEQIEARFAWRWQPSCNEVINIYFFSLQRDNIVLTRVVLIHEAINYAASRTPLHALHRDMASVEVSLRHSHTTLRNNTTIHYNNATLPYVH
jgi:hypothetical protein